MTIQSYAGPVTCQVAIDGVVPPEWGTHTAGDADGCFVEGRVP